jgi:hypothetical protein
LTWRQVSKRSTGHVWQTERFGWREVRGSVYIVVTIEAGEQEVTRSRLAYGGIQRQRGERVCEADMEAGG